LVVIRTERMSDGDAAAEKPDQGEALAVGSGKVGLSHDPYSHCRPFWIVQVIWRAT